MSFEKNSVTIKWSKKNPNSITGIFLTDYTTSSGSSMTEEVDPGSYDIRLEQEGYNATNTVMVPKTPADRVKEINYNSPCFGLKRIDTTKHKVSLKLIDNDKLSSIKIISISGVAVYRSATETSVADLDVRFYHRVVGLDEEGLILESYDISKFKFDSFTGRGLWVDSITVHNSDDLSTGIQGKNAIKIETDPLAYEGKSISFRVTEVDGTITEDLDKAALNQLGGDFRLHGAKIEMVWWRGGFNKTVIYTLRVPNNPYTNIPPRTRVRYSKNPPEYYPSQVKAVRIHQNSPDEVRITLAGLDPNTQYILSTDPRNENTVSKNSDAYGVVKATLPHTSKIYDFRVWAYEGFEDRNMVLAIARFIDTIPALETETGWNNL